MRHLAALLLALVLLSPAGADEPLVVAGIGGQPPLATADGTGGLAGLEPDLVAALCARLQATCTMTVAASWSDLVAGLREGRFAIAFGGLSRLTLESQDIAASTPYLPVLARYAVIARLAGGGDPLESGSAVIGVMRGTPHALWLEARLPPERLYRFADEEELFLSLHTGSVDAVFGDGLMLWQDLLQGPLGQGVVLQGPGIAVEEDALVLALGGDDALAARVDAALAALAGDGTLEALIRRHLPGLPLP